MMDPLDLAKGVQPIQAYHGSPHDFEQFDTSKIGTGEGAQAYGRGLYFAEAEPVAEGYRDALNEKYRSVLSYAGPDRARNAASILAGNHPDETVIEALKSLDDPNPHKSLEEGRKIYEDSKNSGHMYEVAIHAHPDHLLDWDRPLSEQSEHVQNALSNFPSNLTGDEIHQKMFHQSRKELVNQGGGQAYSALTAKKLLESGLKGIKYLDAGSRSAADQPTHNYVVFDPKDIEITRRYEKGGVVRRAYKKGGKVEGSIWHGKDANVEYGEPTNSAIVQHVLAKIAAPLPASVPPLGNVTGRRQ